MFRKILAALVIILGVYIALPFGFGLWNESLGVRGRISFAESPESTEETAGTDDEYPEHPDESPDMQPEESKEIAASEAPLPVEATPLEERSYVEGNTTTPPGEVEVSAESVDIYEDIRTDEPA